MSTSANLIKFIATSYKYYLYRKHLKNMGNLFKKPKSLSKLATFTAVSFLTYDPQRDLIVPTEKRTHVITFLLIGFHFVQVICQIVSVATRVSNLVEMAGGMALTGAYFITFLWRLDLKRDPVPGQMTNVIKVSKGKNTYIHHWFAMFADKSSSELANQPLLQVV